MRITRKDNRDSKDKKDGNANKDKADNGEGCLVFFVQLRDHRDIVCEAVRVRGVVRETLRHDHRHLSAATTSSAKTRPDAGKPAEPRDTGRFVFFLLGPDRTGQAAG
jgi:hypothetical protein